MRGSHELGLRWAEEADSSGVRSRHSSPQSSRARAIMRHTRQEHTHDTRAHAICPTRRPRARECSKDRHAGGSNSRISQWLQHRALTQRADNDTSAVSPICCCAVAVPACAGEHSWTHRQRPRACVRSCVDRRVSLSPPVSLCSVPCRAEIAWTAERGTVYHCSLRALQTRSLTARCPL